MLLILELSILLRYDPIYGANVLKNGSFSFKENLIEFITVRGK